MTSGNPLITKIPVHSRTLPGSQNLLLQMINNARIRKCRQVAELVTFTRNDLSHNSAHDLQISSVKRIQLEQGIRFYLSTSRLRQVIDDIDLLRRSKRTDDFANLERQLFSEA